MYHFGRDDKDAEELDEIERAQRLQWERLVLDNQELLRALGHVRAKHRLSMTTLSQVTAWAAKHYKEFCEICSEVDALALQHGVPQHWRHNLLYFALSGSFDTVGISFPVGYPGMEWTRRPSGEIVQKVILSPYGDVRNPYISSVIRDSQLQADPPPQPLEIGPRGKLDWMPVYEWHLRHPKVKYRELAELLGYSKQWIKEKMAECKAEAGRLSH